MSSEVMMLVGAGEGSVWPSDGIPPATRKSSRTS